MDTQPAPFDPESISSKKRILPIIISILATAIIVGGGIFALEELRLSREIEKLQAEIFQLQKQAQSEPKDDDISAWKTYTNEEYGYSLRYPASMALNVVDGFNSAKTVIEYINNNFDNLSFSVCPFDCGYGPQEPGLLSQAREDYVAGKKIKLTHDQDFNIDFIYFQNDEGKFAKLNPDKLDSSGKIEVYFNDKDSENIYKKILSTFKFLEASADSGEPVSTADWETYKEQN